MALSGTISTSLYGGQYKLYADWSATQSGSTSTITVKSYLYVDWRLEIVTRNGYIEVDGTKKTFTTDAINITSSGTDTTILFNTSVFTKTHTDAVSLPVELYFPIAAYLWDGSSTTYHAEMIATGTISLPATISAPTIASDSTSSTDTTVTSKIKISSNGGENPTKVVYKITSPTTSTKTYDSNTLTHTFTGLTPARKYTVTIVATNSGGDSNTVTQYITTTCSSPRRPNLDSYNRNDRIFK